MASFTLGRLGDIPLSVLPPNPTPGQQVTLRGEGVFVFSQQDGEWKSIATSLIFFADNGTLSTGYLDFEGITYGNGGGPVLPFIARLESILFSVQSTTPFGAGRQYQVRNTGTTVYTVDVPLGAGSFYLEDITTPGILFNVGDRIQLFQSINGINTTDTIASCKVRRVIPVA